MASPVVLSLALLKVNWDTQRKDYLENFVPLVAECIKDLSDDIVSLLALQNKMKELFGIRLPQGSLDRLLARAKQRGYVYLKNHAYFRSVENLARLDFQKIRGQVLRMHETLVESLRRFCDKRYQIIWNSTQAETALQSFLNENQFALTKEKTVSLLSPRKSPDSEKYIVAAFIQNVLDTNDEERDYLETIAKGHMLANAIFLPEPARVSKRFQRTSVYFDTSFLMFVLGYGGEIRREPRFELVELLRETGADLRCFSHTLDEVYGVLYAIAHKIAQGERHDLYGPSAEFFSMAGHSSSDILSLGANLAENLGKMGIKISEKPEYAHDHMMDEKGLSESLAEYYRNPQALQRDIDSISSILRLREGREPVFLEECRALFITTNSLLAEKTAEFFYRDSPASVISPCLTDYAIMNLLWLKQPLRAPDLPWKRVIADCFAATQPDEHLWKSYLAEIAKLEKRGDVSVDEYYVLRYSLEARTALMDITLGREEAFREGTVHDILTRVKELMQENVRHELEVTVSKKEAAEKRANEIQSVLTEKLKAEDLARRKIVEIAQRWAARVFIFVTPGFVALCLLGGLLTFPFGFPPIKTAAIKYSVAVLQWLMAALSVAGMIWGTALTSLLSKMQNRLADFIAKQLGRIKDL